MGFGSYNHSALTEIRRIAARLLEGFSTAQIIETGCNVIRVLEDVKKQHPDKIPTKQVGGLLDMGPFPINDFELALHLVGSNNPAMTEIIESANGLPALIAYLETYLEILGNNTKLPDESWLESALSYAILAQKFEGDVAKLFNQDLKKDVEELRPLAKTGQKFVNGRKPAALGPVAKKVKAYLQKNPKAKPLDVWCALAKSPPSGLTFMDTARLGRYVEKGSETVMEWRRFQNLVSEHRPKG